MFFTPVDGKTNRARCDTCRNEYSFSGGSTSNLSLHICTKHPSLANGLPQSKRRRTWTGEDRPTANADITVERGTFTIKLLNMQNLAHLATNFAHSYLYLYM